MSEFHLTSLQTITGSEGFPYYVIGRVPLDGGRFARVSLRMKYSHTSVALEGPTVIYLFLRAGDCVNEDGSPAEPTGQEFVTGFTKLALFPSTQTPKPYRRCEIKLTVPRYPYPYDKFIESMAQGSMFTSILDLLAQAYPTMVWEFEPDQCLPFFVRLTKNAIQHVTPAQFPVTFSVIVSGRPYYRYIEGDVAYYTALPSADPAAQAPQFLAPPEKAIEPSKGKAKASKPKAAKGKGPEVAPGVTSSEIGL